MFGAQMGSLRILRRSSTGGGPSTETLLWSRQDQVGNYWERAEVDLDNVDQPFQVLNQSFQVINQSFQVLNQSLQVRQAFARSANFLSFTGKDLMLI